MKDTIVTDCSDVFSLAVKLKTFNNNYGDYRILMNRIKDLLSSFEIKARGKNKAEDIADVKYALIALLDEIILTSEWPERETWSSHSLQLEFFNENIAGTEFFNRLDHLRERIASKFDVLKIYYFCLRLGFEGKYKIEGLENLRFLTDNLATDIKRMRSDQIIPLSPNWEPPTEFIKKIKQEIPAWVIGIGCFFVSMIFYVVYQFLIARDSSKVLNVLEGIFYNLSQ